MLFAGLCRNAPDAGLGSAVVAHDAQFRHRVFDLADDQFQALVAIVIRNVQKLVDVPVLRQRTLDAIAGATTRVLPAVHFLAVCLPEIRRQRSEERRVGKECDSTCRSRWSPYHYNKRHITTLYATHVTYHNHT